MGGEREQEKHARGTSDVVEIEDIVVARARLVVVVPHLVCARLENDATGSDDATDATGSDVCGEIHEM